MLQDQAPLAIMAPMGEPIPGDPEVLPASSGSPGEFTSDRREGAQPSDAGKLTMMEFAMKFFRHGPPPSAKGTLKKHKQTEWTWKEIADTVKFSNAALPASLLRLESPEYNQMARDTFVAIMQYMQDYPLKKGQSITDSVYQILMICHKHPPMRDEVYCQIIKQTTNNKSSKPDSPLRGWRLFSMLTAYFDCSDVLKPYLFKYLSDASSDTRRAYHGTALVCYQNLQKTFKFGGRKYLLAAKEIEAITMGKNLKRQIYHLPGGTKKIINTRTVSVVEDVIQELCSDLNVLSPLEQQEFCLSYVVEAENTLKLLANDEYILDVTTELETARREFFLLLKRTVWIHPLRLDNDLYIDVMFFQVVPDYLEGLLVVMKSQDSISASTLDDIAMLGALLYRADERNQGYIRENNVDTLVPRLVLETVRGVTVQGWADRINSKLRQMSPNGEPLHARAKFLEVLQTWQLFGSTFFFVHHVSDERMPVECLVAVNKNGVQLLNPLTHQSLLDFSLSEVLSTHKVAMPAAGREPVQMLDIKLGNLLQKRVVRLQTDQGAEISRLIGQYIYVNSQNRGFIKGGAAITAN